MKIAVVSPHLDDAVLSLGATIARAVAEGSEVTVLTVLAGDPGSDAPAGAWDRSGGFRTEGEAARIRREEDRRACAMVGATPVWLPFGDEQYERRGTDDDVALAMQDPLRAADRVLVPGFPLVHQDHAFVAGLALGLDLPGEVRLYVEQPYVVVRRAWRPWLWPYRPGVADPIAGRLAETPRWTTVRFGARERRAKRRACRAYRTQIPLIGRYPPVLLRMAIYESVKGGETVGSISRTKERS